MRYGTSSRDTAVPKFTASEKVDFFAHFLLISSCLRPDLPDSFEEDCQVKIRRQKEGGIAVCKALIAPKQA